MRLLGSVQGKMNARAQRTVKHPSKANLQN